MLYWASLILPTSFVLHGFQVIYEFFIDKNIVGIDKELMYIKNNFFTLY